MQVDLIRFDSQNDWTRGVLFINGKGFCFTMEDEARTKKVKGETRIPAGDYDLEFKKVETSLTKKYRKKYDFFKWHIEVKNGPGFENIYIHVGNTDDHTEGCILLGYLCDMTRDNFIGKSAIAYEDFYKQFDGGKLTIHDI